MKNHLRPVLILIFLFHFICLGAFDPSTSNGAGAQKSAVAATSDKLGKPNAAFSADKMPDMSDFDPANPVIPTGDTIKIALVGPFSGPASLNGQLMFTIVQWVAHDLNKRGGLLVDGKKKLIQVIKADHMYKVDQCKKICERMALQEKAHFFWGTDTTMLTKVVNDVAKKYKIIAVNPLALSDELQDVTNFSRYCFQAGPSARQIGRAMAYFFGQIRKTENKFYLLNPDYSGGHAVIEAFKSGLAEYYPSARLIGEDYYKLFLTDFAPYLTKIKTSGADIIFTGAFSPDANNILKQARQMGIKLPFAPLYFDLPEMLQSAGIDGSKDIMNIAYYSETNPYFKTKEEIAYYEKWRKAQEKWKSPPYNGLNFRHGIGNVLGWTMATYWFMSVIERAQSLDPEKIIPLWENDSYKYVNGKVVKMRACDHKMVLNLAVYETVPPGQQKVSMNIPPYSWFEDLSYMGPLHMIPAAKILPWMDTKLERCMGKNEWGE